MTAIALVQLRFTCGGTCTRRCAPMLGTDIEKQHLAVLFLLVFASTNIKPLLALDVDVDTCKTDCDL